MYMKGGYIKCLTLFCSPEVGGMRQNGVRYQNYAVSKKINTATINIGSKMNHCWVIDYDPTLIRFGSDILKIVAVFIFLNTAF